MRAAENQLIEENGEVAKLMDHLAELHLARERTYPSWAQFSRSNQFLHGVLATNVDKPNLAHQIPEGMSSMFISRRTPLPTRIITHEFFGHYVDNHVLDHFPAARRTFERMTEGMGKTEKAEMFAEWAEEYVLLGGGANLPSDLKPALETLSKRALEETAGYAGRAGDRVPLPPEMAEVFDILNGYRKATGNEYTPGVSSWREATHGLVAKYDERPPMEAEDAVFVGRWLSLNDKVQQIHGQARSGVTRATVERLADAVSQAMMGEGRMAGIARKILPTASSEMRVPAAAARELAIEARRALARLHPEMKALPKEGTAADVAHYWWAQLPESQWNVQGLQNVRARQAAEYEMLQSPETLESFSEGLDNVRAEMQELRRIGEDGSDEYMELLERQGKIKGLITDLPHRMDDLGRSIAGLDVVIAARPTLDTKIIDAVRTLSRERERLLIQVGAHGADPERFAARRGLLGEWLGHEPTGEEIYIGHRLGKVRGSQATLTPASIGLGKARTPEGLSHANQLVLANSGRLRQSTHVAAEDWMASEVYRSALKMREDLALMGVPYEGGRIGEDFVLVNPKGRLVPKAWKTDPFVGLTDEMEGEIAKHLDGILGSFAARGGDEAAEDALKAFAREQSIPLDDLRVVSKKAYERYKNRALPAGGSTKGGTVYDNLVNVMAANLNFLRVGYFPKNIAQNLIMAVAHLGA
jgi:hypothetical protein